MNKFSTLKETIALLKSGELTSADLTRETLDRIRSKEDSIHAFIHLDEEKSMQDARNADRLLQDGKGGMLTGIPIAIKDNISTKGIPTTCASKILENYIPPYDATCIKRLVDRNYVFIGKTNMDEFAMGSSTECSAFQVTRNPVDTECVPGGSSGGSAAAVASGEVAVALGSDTGGSVRQPASYCGIVGLKPSYGRISRYGLIAYGSSLDQIGIMTRNVEDAAIVLQELAGQDPLDGTSSPSPVDDYVTDIDTSLRGKKIGVIAELFGEEIDSDVKEAIKESLKAYQKLGAEVETVSLKHLKHAISTFYILAMSEASTNLSRFDGVRYGERAKHFDSLDDMYIKTRSEGFGEEVKRRILVGTFTLSEGYYDQYYNKALQIRSLIVEDFAKAFQKYDVLVSPTTPNVAFRIGEKIDDPVSMYLEDLCTVPVNLAGLPAISIPCGTKGILPIGIQVIAKQNDEKTMLQFAFALESALRRKGRE